MQVDKNPKEKAQHEIGKIIISCGFPKQKDLLWKSPTSKGKIWSIVPDQCFPEVSETIPDKYHTIEVREQKPS